MTTTTTSAKVQYNGDDSTTAFATTFKFIKNSHVKVVLRDSSAVETALIETTDYTLVGAGDDSGGTLTMIVAPATGEVLTIKLDVPFTQAKAFPLGGPFPSTQVEEMGDLAAMAASKNNENFERTLHVPESDSQNDTDLEIPIDNARASKFLAFDASGKPIAAAGTSANLGPVSAYIDTLLTAIDADAARLTLDAMSKLTPQQGGVLDTNGFAIDFSEGAAVASAATTDVWATDGNTIHVTGATTITSFGTAPRVGAIRWVIFDGAPLLTNSANLALPGLVDFQASAGDILRIYADTTTQFDIRVFKQDGRAVIGALTLATEQLTIAGTIITFSGIPSWVKRITIMFFGVTTNGTSRPIIQLGDSGGIETSGYFGSVVEFIDAGAVLADNVTDGFGLSDAWAGTRILNGAITLMLEDDSEKTWVASGTPGLSDSARGMLMGGSKSLTATLDRVAITTTGGTDQFDLGAINILYE